MHGANVQPGQLVGVSAFARPGGAGAGGRRGGLPARREVRRRPLLRPVREARPDRARRPRHARLRPGLAAAPGCSRSPSASARGSASAGRGRPEALEGLDGARLGRDQLPWLKESMKVLNDRVDQLVRSSRARRATGPSSSSRSSTPDEAYERLWSELWHVLRLDEPDPAAAWDERIALLKTSSEALNDRRFDAIELKGPGTELTVGLLPTSHWQAGDFETRFGVRHLPNLPTEEVFTAPDPLRVDGHVTSTKPLVLKDGTIVRGLRGALRGRAGGRDRRRRERRGAARQDRASTRARPGSASSRSSTARAGSGRSGPSSTTRCSTRTPRATSRSAAPTRSRPPRRIATGST